MVTGNRSIGASKLTRRSFLSGSMLALAALPLVACAPEASGGSAPTKGAGDPGQPHTLRFGSVQAEGHANVKAQQVFADELSKTSKTFTSQVYPAGQLGGIVPQIEATQLGTQELIVANPATAASFIPEMDVMNLLYLAKSQEKTLSAVDGELGKRLDQASQEKGLKILAWWASGPRNFVNNSRPIKTPSDLKGMTLRVQPSPIWLDSMKAMGANPISLDFVEVYSAMQTNQIDGFENLTPDIQSGHFNEVTKYLSLTKHQYDLFTVFVNKDLWDGFTDLQRTQVSAAMKKATDFQRKTQEADLTTSLKALRSLMKVNDVSAKNRKLFADKVKPVWNSLEKTVGKDLLDFAKQQLS